MKRSWRFIIEIKNPNEESFSTFPGPVLLIGGPGTGKTYQLAKRVKYLFEESGARADEVAVITFTNEAAKNMHNELSNKNIDIPKEKHPKIISTMHRIIRFTHSMDCPSSLHGNRIIFLIIMKPKIINKQYNY